MVKEKPKQEIEKKRFPVKSPDFEFIVMYRKDKPDEQELCEVIGEFLLKYWHVASLAVPELRKIKKKYWLICINWLNDKDTLASFVKLKNRPFFVISLDSRGIKKLSKKLTSMLWLIGNIIIHTMLCSVEKDEDKIEKILGREFSNNLFKALRLK